ncbi:hypothetical protein J6590_006549 [Homalodisca vitripennis]|nr:hypothetical protein J6590_006549 [Homalodisca vitripennis]
MDEAKSEEAWRPKPGVINMNMITEAINRMVEDEVPGNVIDEEEGYRLHEITHIYLEHLDIYRIDHLWVLPALTILKLTGNNIQKIENLDALVNLVDLNLSFNRIENIENLNHLAQLRHLSLFSNLITELANLENLKNLKIFTIGGNKIEDKQCPGRRATCKNGSLNDHLSKQQPRSTTLDPGGYSPKEQIRLQISNRRFTDFVNDNFTLANGLNKSCFLHDPSIGKKTLNPEVAFKNNPVVTDTIHRRL